jgi:hypothetical protein
MQGHSQLFRVFFSSFFFFFSSEKIYFAGKIAVATPCWHVSTLLAIVVLPEGLKGGDTFCEIQGEGFNVKVGGGLGVDPSSGQLAQKDLVGDMQPLHIAHCLPCVLW